LKKGVAFENIRFAERYISSDAHLFVRFVVPFKFADYVSCSQCRNEGEVVVPGGLVQSDRPRTSFHGGSEQQMVFVEDVKLMEPPKKVIPSTVWTQRVDEIFRRLGNAMCFSTRFGFVEFLTLKDRKVDFRLDNADATCQLTAK
jgi:hypothetical protein